MGAVVVVGGTQGLGLSLVTHYAEQGRSVVLTGRDAGRAAEIAGVLAASPSVVAAGGTVSGIAVDLGVPEDIEAALAGIGEVDRLALVAIERDQNTIKDYNIGRAVRLATLKLVGYSEVVHTLVPRLFEGASVVMFGGIAKDRAYTGSTTVSTVNGGIDALVRSLALELSPVRVNGLHPGIVPDTPYWQDKGAFLEPQLQRVLAAQPVSTNDITDAAVFLLENPSVNGANLSVDGGYRHT
ncbi:SDR family oxidoreductase [Streptomyces sp. SID1121]|uniref:SDR family oxidoreductase n=1 Tax=Streptomyces sp. SID1121 TaxID=3425888 RepID=UPI0040579F55